MLQQLFIRNFALIEEMVIPFHPGLTVLSGETGAGKSIVVDAVSLVLGGKADRDMVRRGCDKAYVEGTFSTANQPAVRAFLQQEGMEQEDDILVISRDINHNGRSTCRVNGTLVNLQILKALASLLMEIHGQHEHQALLSDENHIQFLDSLGDEGYFQTLAQTSDLYHTYRQQQRDYDALQRENEYRQERLDRLYRQKKELDQANLQDGEEEELIKNRDLLRNSDKINRALKSAASLLSEGDGQQDAALPLVKQAVQAMQEITGIQAEFDELTQKMDGLYFELEDIAYSLQKRHHALDLDGSQLDDVEARLDVIKRMEKKYGTSISEVLMHQQKVEAEIAKYENLDDQIEQLKLLSEKSMGDYLRQAKNLSALRYELAQATQKKIEKELSQLNMPAARFYIQIDTDEHQASSRGIDKVAFYIAANKGEEKKPLSKTASGGELSRIMLAIKSVSSERTMVPCMVFDEVDAGISGRTATVVAEKMWDIARYRQVICVTHLQQIAVMASSHALVSKFETKERTKTEVQYLDGNERAQEIARLLGETRKSDVSGIQHAVSLLRDAEAYRMQHPANDGDA